MCTLDLVMAKVWSERQQRARKQHRCSACHGPIAAGELYWTHFSVCDTEKSFEKLCALCYADRAEFAAAHDGSLPNPAALMWVIEECIEENSWANEHYGGDPAENRRWQAMLERMTARGGT